MVKLVYREVTRPRCHFRQMGGGETPLKYIEKGLLASLVVIYFIVVTGFMALAVAAITPRLFLLLWVFIGITIALSDPEIRKQNGQGKPKQIYC